MSRTAKVEQSGDGYKLELYENGELAGPAQRFEEKFWGSMDVAKFEAENDARRWVQYGEGERWTSKLIMRPMTPAERQAKRAKKLREQGYRQVKYWLTDDERRVLDQCLKDYRELYDQCGEACAEDCDEAC